MINNEEKITHSKNYSSIFIKKKLHMIFGTLDNVSDEEKIRIALKSFKDYFEIIQDYEQKIILSWRDALQYEWTFSDDLRIIQVLKRGDNPPKGDKYGTYNRGYIRTCVGVFPINPKTIMDTKFELHPNRYAIGQSKKDFNERLKTRDFLTEKEELFCTFVANGMDKGKAYIKSYNTNDIFYASMSANRLLQQERIQSSISQEVDNILTQKGVSKSFIIEKYKQLIEDGLIDLKHCSASVRSALRDLAEMSNMMPDKKKIISSVSSQISEIPEDRLLAIKEKRAKIMGLNPAMEITNESIRNINIAQQSNKQTEKLSYNDNIEFNELLS